MSRSLLCVALLLGSVALAKEPKLKGTVKESAPKIDLGLPTFDALPTNTELEKPKEKAAQQPIHSTPDGPPYAVVSVVSGKAFVHTPKGTRPSAPFPGVAIDGDPPMTEKFSTVVRVKSVEKGNVPIDVAVLDLRGDTVMEAHGQLYFKGGDESEWTVDWEPTGVRRPGDLQVLVRVGGQPLGTFPLKAVLAPPK